MTERMGRGSTALALLVAAVALLAAGALAVPASSGVAGVATPGPAANVTSGSVVAGGAPADVDGDGLDEIGVFAVEAGGRARGPWFQLYRANGTLVSGFFLEAGMSDFHIRRIDVDADPLQEVVVLAVDAAGVPVLEVRDGDGSSLGRQQVAETGAVELMLFALEVDGGGAAEIGIGYSRPGSAAMGSMSDPEEPPLGPGFFEIWSLGSTGGLVRGGGTEVIPDGFANPEWRALDADGDGIEEVLAGYTQAPVSRSQRAADATGAAADPGSAAHFRVVNADGTLVAETTVAADDFDDAQWVVGDFLEDHPGDELLVGLRRKRDGAAIGRLFDAASQLRSVKASPPGASELTWDSIAGPAPSAAGGNEPVREGPAERQVFVGYRLENGPWEYGVWDWPDATPVRVGGGAILGAGVQVREWLTADFDGRAANGGEVVTVYTFGGDRSTHFQHWSRAGFMNRGSGRLFDGTFIEIRARPVEAARAGRRDLLVVGRPVGEAPRLALWNVNGSGKLLLDQDVLNRHVR